MLSLTPLSSCRSKTGVNCEHCELGSDASLCRFDASDPFPLNYTDTSTVNCFVRPKASTVGFAGLSFSNNGGSDWTELVAHSEHAIVNFAAEPSTHTVRGLVFQHFSSLCFLSKMSHTFHSPPPPHPPPKIHCTRAFTQHMHGYIIPFKPIQCLP